MLKMFNPIDIGERAGSGILNIFRVWHEQGWTAPVISVINALNSTITSVMMT